MHSFKQSFFGGNDLNKKSAKKRKVIITYGNKRLVDCMKSVMKDIFIIQ